MLINRLILKILIPLFFLTSDMNVKWGTDTFEAEISLYVFYGYNSVRLLKWTQRHWDQTDPSGKKL